MSEKRKVVYNGRDGSEVIHPTAGKFKKGEPREIKASIAEKLVAAGQGFAYADEVTPQEEGGDTVYEPADGPPAEPDPEDEQ